jgi:hypothetical protein
VGKDLEGKIGIFFMFHEMSRINFTSATFSQTIGKSTPLSRPSGAAASWAFLAMLAMADNRKKC